MRTTEHQNAGRHRGHPRPRRRSSRQRLCYDRLRRRRRHPGQLPRRPAPRRRDHRRIDQLGLPPRLGRQLELLLQQHALRTAPATTAATVSGRRCHWLSADARCSDRVSASAVPAACNPGGAAPIKLNALWNAGTPATSVMIPAGCTITVTPPGCTIHVSGPPDHRQQRHRRRRRPGLDQRHDLTVGLRGQQRRVHRHRRRGQQPGLLPQ